MVELHILFPEPHLLGVIRASAQLLQQTQAASNVRRCKHANEKVYRVGDGRRGSTLRVLMLLYLVNAPPSDLKSTTVLENSFASAL